MAQGDERTNGRREEILMAAASVFSDQGYRASTIQDIGRELGITSAALYYYFSSKQDLLAELIVRPIRQLSEMAMAISQSDLSSRDKLSAITRGHITMMLKDRELFTIFLRERVELDSAHAAHLAELEDRYYQRIRGIFDEAARAGELREVNLQLAALGLIGMTNWVLRWYRPDGPLGALQIADGLMEIICGGVFRERLVSAGDSPAIGRNSSRGGSLGSNSIRSRRSAKPLAPSVRAGLEK